MEAWIDIIFIAIVVIFAIVGIVKGLFDSLLSLVASVASIFLAFWASKPVAEFLNRVADVNQFFEKFLVEKNIIPEAGMNGKTVEQWASICTVVLSIIIVYVLIKVAVWLLAKLFDSVTANSTAFSGMDRLLGMVFGAVQGFAVVLMVLGLASMLSFVPNLNTKIDNYLDKNSNFTLKTYHYVQEWVEDELQDKLDEFVEELAGKAPTNPTEEETTNYAQLAYTQMNNLDITTGAVTDTTLNYTLPAQKHVENAEGNIDVDINWGLACVLKLGTETVDTLTINNGVVTKAGLVAGTYTLEFTNVKFTLGAEGEDGYQTYTGNVTLTFTVA